MLDSHLQICEVTVNTSRLFISEWVCMYTEQVKMVVTEKSQHNSLLVPTTAHTCKVNMKVNKQINMYPVFQMSILALMKQRMVIWSQTQFQEFKTLTKLNSTPLSPNSSNEIKLKKQTKKKITRIREFYSLLKCSSYIQVCNLVRENCL